MTVIAYARRIQCDTCLKQAEMPGKVAPDRAWLDEPVPDGWTSMRAVVLRVDFKDIFGTPLSHPPTITCVLSHLCDECSALTIGELVRRLAAKFTGSQEAPA